MKALQSAKAWPGWVFTVFAVLATFCIAGCTHHTGTETPSDLQDAHWQGRLALRVHSDPVQAFSSDFALRGTPQAGKLDFFSPLGNTLARLEWSENIAILQAGAEQQHFASLAALTRHATGSELPVASLFAWLQGLASDAPGWNADLQNISTGRLRAWRVQPDPPVELTIILER